jgi:hypothetical protein
VPDWVAKGTNIALAGRGGTNKSMFLQQLGTMGAAGRPFVSGAHEPFVSLVIDCEDDHDEMWRREELICEHEGIEMAALHGKLHLESWVGCDNALMVKGRDAMLLQTPAFDRLAEQVNDLRCDFVSLNSVAHLLLADHDNRTEVTQFVNACAGLGRVRPLTVCFTLHTSRADGSEFTGSVAWENALRMRWFMGNRLPDQRAEGDEPQDRNVRYLAKRKANYAALDYVRFTTQGPLLVPDHAPQEGLSGLMAQLDDQRAEQVCAAGFRTLVGMGLLPSDTPQAADFLPKQLLAKGLASGFTKQQLTKAMHRLMTAGTFARAVVGKHPNRADKWGLKLQREAA